MEITPGIKVLKTSWVGSYQFDILKSDDPDALNEWLEMSGLQILNKKEKKIVKDYIDEEWVFAVARLKREFEGVISAPHPISFTFETKEPVYPMRLIGLASKLPDLYLYVIADQKAWIPGYTTIFSDELVSDPQHEFYGINSLVWRGKNYNYNAIGHKDLIPLFWEGCNLTSIHASIQLELASEDINFRFKKPLPEKFAVYYQDAALSRALFYPFVILSSILYLYHLAWWIQNRFMGRKWKIHSAIYMVFLILMIISFLLIWNSIPSMKKMGMKDSGISLDWHYPNDWQTHDVPGQINKHKIDLSSVSKEDLTQYIMDNENLNNHRWSSEEIICEDSPGNFTLDKNEKGEWILTVYDLWGIAHDSNLNDECKAIRDWYKSK